jgi:glycosyltransferase involved in cell wall biosynthesis
MSSTALRVACFSPYPASAASPRHRILAYREIWGRAGVELTFWPFMSDRFYEIRRRFSPLAKAEKSIWFGLATLLLFCRILRVRRFDAIIIHRELFPLGGATLDRIVAYLNPRLFFDLDDAIWFPPSQSVNQRSRWWDPRRTAQVMAACRHVVAGSAYIQKYAQQFNARVSVVPTSYDDLGGPRQKPEAVQPVIVWIGNWGNAEYLELITSALTALAQEISFELRLIGGPDVFSLRIPGVSIDAHLWNQYSEAALLTSADIGLMPLYARDHEQGKCAFKLVQYYSAGLAVVASPVGVNRDLVKHGHNGYLADSHEEWLSSLRVLLANREIRLEFGRAGYASYLEAFTRDSCANQWLALLRHL